MPAPLMSREEVLARLMARFRAAGYDGASLAELSAATGLGKSSLYHYFPGGKADMAAQVLAHLDEQLSGALYTPLRDKRAPARKLDALVQAIDEFYEGGKKACLLERLCASVNRAAFRRPLARAFSSWIEAVEGLCLEAGVPAATAHARAVDFVVRVEGALVVCAGTCDLTIFGRTLDDLRRSLLAA